LIKLPTPYGWPISYFYTVGLGYDFGGLR
jgi:hypothetical protein